MNVTILKFIGRMLFCASLAGVQGCAVEAGEGGVADTSNVDETTEAISGAKKQQICRKDDAPGSNREQWYDELQLAKKEWKSSSDWKTCKGHAKQQKWKKSDCKKVGPLLKGLSGWCDVPVAISSAKEREKGGDCSGAVVEWEQASMSAANCAAKR